MSKIDEVLAGIAALQRDSPDPVWWFEALSAACVAHGQGVTVLTDQTIDAMHERVLADWSTQWAPKKRQRLNDGQTVELVSGSEPMTVVRDSSHMDVEVSYWRDGLQTARIPYYCLRPVKGDETP